MYFLKMLFLFICLVIIQTITAPIDTQVNLVDTFFFSLFFCEELNHWINDFSYVRFSDQFREKSTK